MIVGFNHKLKSGENTKYSDTCDKYELKIGRTTFIVSSKYFLEGDTILEKVKSLAISNMD